MHAPLIAAALAGAILILQQGLMLTVGTRRTTTLVGVGYAGDPNLERLVRRHGNLAENAGIFIVVLALIEILTGSSTVVTTFAGVFLAARIFHAIGFSSLAGSHGGDHAAGPKKIFIAARALGATATAILGIAAGAYLLNISYGLLIG